ncbi:MAG: mechanosensitive ion channel, partial [Nitrosomonas sp.]|nr:mechanosensitive ion channel [Nitrosomonas sp.]
MNNKLLATIIFAILILSNPLHADQIADLIAGEAPSKDTPKAEKVIEVNGSPHNDDKIQQRIQKIFSELDDLQHIDVQVSNGIVTLRGDASSSLTEAKALQISQQVEGVVEVVNELVVTHNLEKRLKTTWQKLTKTFGELAASLPLFLLAILVFVLAWMLGRWISRRKNFYLRIAPNYFIADLLGQITHFLFILLGLVLALSLLDLTALLGTILGAAGIVGLAIGFAVRDTVENYIASILLSLRNPFEVNDLVNIDGNEGNVVRLTARATILLSQDGNHIRIPNSTVFKAIITNFTRNSERRFQFDVGVDAGQDLLETQTLALATLNATEGVLTDPKPMVIIETLGDFNVVLRIYFWIDQAKYNPLIVRSEAIRQVKQAFDDANIIMPEPIYQVRVKNEISKNLAQEYSTEQLDTH